MKYRCMVRLKRRSYRTAFWTLPREHTDSRAAAFRAVMRELGEPHYPPELVQGTASEGWSYDVRDGSESLGYVLVKEAPECVSSVA